MCSLNLFNLESGHSMPPHVHISLGLVLKIVGYRLQQTSQKPHDFRQREHKPEGFEEEFL
jgi:hypothetical protein